MTMDWQNRSREGVTEIGKPARGVPLVAGGVVETLGIAGNNFRHSIAAQTSLGRSQSNGTPGSEGTNRLRAARSLRVRPGVTMVHEADVELMQRSFEMITDGIRGGKRPGAGTARKSTQFPDGENTPSWQCGVAQFFLRATIKQSLNSMNIADRMMEFSPTGPDPEMRRARVLARIRNARTMIVTTRRLWPAFVRGITITPAGIPGVDAEWFIPDGKSSGRTIVYLPGGAFVLPATALHRTYVARLAQATGAKVLLVHYRLAPENPFPAGLSDCIAAYRHVVREGTDPDRIALAGDSAGGGLVVSTLLSLRDAGEEMPAVAALASPFLDLSCSGQSHADNIALDPMLSLDQPEVLASMYTGESAAVHPLVSPIFADLSRLPPILSQVGSTEILLDDTLSLAEKAREAGTSVSAEVWHGMHHVWHVTPALPEAFAATDRIVDFLDATMGSARKPSRLRH